MATRVKICGITRLEDAELAAACGAWAIGMVMWPESPRYCGTERAAEIATAMRRRLEVTGVFVNAPLDEVVAVARDVPLTMVQLHGEEGPSYCAEARRRTGLKVVKAARVRDMTTVRELTAYHTDFHLLDAYVPGRPGGTGRRFDWEIAAAHPDDPPFLLSGGLDPGNVTEAIAVAEPFAVDVSSGVEAEAGVKDPGRMRSFFEAVDTAAARVG